MNGLGEGVELTDLIICDIMQKKIVQNCTMWTSDLITEWET
jgi:hypothetical protein